MDSIMLVCLVPCSTPRNRIAVLDIINPFWVLNKALGLRLTQNLQTPMSTWYEFFCKASPAQKELHKTHKVTEWELSFIKHAAVHPNTHTLFDLQAQLLPFCDFNPFMLDPPQIPQLILAEVRLVLNNGTLVSARVSLDVRVGIISFFSEKQTLIQEMQRNEHVRVFIPLRNKLPITQHRHA